MDVSALRPGLNRPLHRLTGMDQTILLSLSVADFNILGKHPYNPNRLLFGFNDSSLLHQALPNYFDRDALLTAVLCNCFSAHVLWLGALSPNLIGCTDETADRSRRAGRFGLLYCDGSGSCIGIRSMLPVL